VQEQIVLTMSSQTKYTAEEGLPWAHS